MKVVIEIECDSPAFFGGKDGTTPERNTELLYLLRELAGIIAQDDEENLADHTIIDRDGLNVGEMKVIKEQPCQTKKQSTHRVTCEPTNPT